jgi:hypothetical protein
MYGGARRTLCAFKEQQRATPNSSAWNFIIGICDCNDRNGACTVRKWVQLRSIDRDRARAGTQYVISGPLVAGQTGPVQPVLQAQDGSFVGTVGTNTGAGYMIAFDATGNVRWAVPNESPQIATADGGVIGRSGITYDQNGNATGQLGGLSTPSWSAEWYALAGTGLSEILQSQVQYASSFETVAGGNLSGNLTSVPFLAWSEGLPLFALGRGPRCQVGGTKVPLGGNALQQYTDLKQALLSGGYLTSQSCSTFFNADPTRASYFGQLTNGVTRQVPYDGSQSNISLYDAGLWTAADANDPRNSATFPSQWKKTPVCAYFQSTTGNVNIAMAQTQPPATDVYLHTNANILRRYLRQSTVLHEALHSLTGLTDNGLEQLLGLTPTASQGKATDVINTTLENNSCAVRPHN